MCDVCNECERRKFKFEKEWQFVLPKMLRFIRFFVSIASIHSFSLLESFYQMPCQILDGIEGKERRSSFQWINNHVLNLIWRDRMKCVANLTLPVLDCVKRRILHHPAFVCLHSHCFSHSFFFILFFHRFSHFHFFLFVSCKFSFSAHVCIVRCSCVDAA